ncbi:MAG: iron chaperone [Candidatus Rokuibacteriota bacterium]
MGVARAKTIDQYLAAIAEDKRGALEGLRKTIRAAAPGAEECISYGLPAARLEGKVLVLFGESGGHCAFYPGSGTAVEAHRGELKGYQTSKGAIRFEAARPLPASLVRKLVKYRIAEHTARQRHAGGARRRR